MGGRQRPPGFRRRRGRSVGRAWPAVDLALKPTHEKPGHAPRCFSPGRIRLAPLPGPLALVADVQRPIRALPGRDLRLSESPGLGAPIAGERQSDRPRGGCGRRARDARLGAHALLLAGCGCVCALGCGCGCGCGSAINCDLPVGRWRTLAAVRRRSAPFGGRCNPFLPLEFPRPSLLHIVGSVVPQVMHAIRRAELRGTVGHDVDEARLPVRRSGVSKRGGQRPALAFPAYERLDVVGGPNVVVARLVAGFPDQFEGTTRRHGAIQGPRQPAKLPVRGEAGTCHPTNADLLPPPNVSAGLPGRCG